jgi:phospholipase/carboxylesterase
MPLPRRAFLTGCAAAGLSLRPGWRGLLTPQPGSPVLKVRPGKRGTGPAPKGVTSLGLGGGRDGQLAVPGRYTPAEPLPLVLTLHGATMSGADMVRRLGPLADQAGVILVAPDSREFTWDGIRGDFGPDIPVLERALESVWSRYAVDPRRISVAGFSDGATYALALGLANGGLFPRVAAFSPGFLIPVPRAGRPRFFVSHGRQDEILPIDRCGRPVVRALRQAGYQVDFREFDGGHTVPPALATAALDQLAAHS